MNPQSDPTPVTAMVCSVKAPAPRLNLENSDAFKSDVRARMPHQCKRIAVDMSETDFVDSSGIGALVALRKAVGPDGTVMLSQPTAYVRRVLKLTRMESVFEVQPPLD